MACLSALSSPGASAVGAAAATAPTMPVSASGDDVDEPATEADLQAQQERLEELRRAMREQTDDLERARAEMKVMALEAATALEKYSTARRRLQKARSLEVAERRALLTVRLDVAENRRELGRWARRAYQGGATLEEHPGLVTLLSARSTDEAAATLAWMRGVGRARGRVVDEVESTETAQTQVVARVRIAAEAASVAETEAGDARREKDDVLTRQRATVERLEELLAATRKETRAVRKERKRLRAEIELAEQQQRSAAPDDGGSGNRVTGPVGDCPGGDTALYDNGRIPVEALCALWADPRHRLRADAAHAFDQLSKAYVEEFGKPPCLTDSYRSYEEQVSLYARKPNLAARPGTSNHGWGTAADLCGGVQSFGSRTHEWMALKGPLFGWFHPAWAQRGGSRPEPWHFEYGA